MVYQEDSPPQSAAASVVSWMKSEFPRAAYFMRNAI